jgi:hypothetical protein
MPCRLVALQDWLTSIEIKFYESKVNLNWKNIIKSIKEVSVVRVALSCTLRATCSRNSRSRHCSAGPRGLRGERRLELPRRRSERLGGRLRARVGVRAEVCPDTRPASCTRTAWSPPIAPPLFTDLHSPLCLAAVPTTARARTRRAARTSRSSSLTMTASTAAKTTRRMRAWTGMSSRRRRRRTTRSERLLTGRRMCARALSPVVDACLLSCYMASH